MGRNIGLAGFLLAMMLSIESCGGGADSAKCGQIIGLDVAPFRASADHNDIPNGNAQFFTSTLELEGGSGCPAITAASQVVTWTTADPSVTVSPTLGTSSTATCTTGTPGAITITATATLSTGQVVSGHASLACR